MSDARSTLAKQKIVLALLAQYPSHASLHRKFRDCLHHIPHYISRMYSRGRNVETNQIRCPLKYRCPKCMDPINIKAARKADFVALLKASQRVGGRRPRVWLLRWESCSPKDSTRLSQSLSRTGARHTPIIRGEWGGEICGRFKAIVDSNGPKPTAPCVFNSLVFAASNATLDESWLRRKFPGMTIEPFHGRIDAAWEEYLRRWSVSQISDAMPNEIVGWMTYKGRLFHPIGRLRRTRSEIRKEYAAKLLAEMGRSARLGFFHRLEQSEVVLARIERDLPLAVSNLLDRVLQPDERITIMATLKQQVRNVLQPSMDPDDVFMKPMSELELRLRLEEIRKQNVELIKMLKDRDKDSTSTRTPGKSDKVQ